MQFNTFKAAIDFVREKLITQSYVVRTEKWQGITLEHDMRETLNTSFTVAMDWSIEQLIKDIKPNLPWADIHLQERVGGLPLNPGESYKQWPFYKMDEKMRNVGDKFSHTYMERFWPKCAGELECHQFNTQHLTKWEEQRIGRGIMGIRYAYGDLEDLKNLLFKEPFTRQAFLPVFFPEDTGAVHGGRIPCTIGYHFIRREQSLHVVYYIRSCDYLRHFRDDIYLCVRLVNWLLDRLRDNPLTSWKDVRPGTFTMHITSLHIFENEYELVKRFNK